jgi:methylmalonyl-CoA mutase cobalamin-binding subunit
MNMDMLSIGALSRITDVPVETLRTWERRYGFPMPQRRASGHRRYPASVAERVVLVRQALQAGHRAAAVVSAPPETLRRLVAGPGPGSGSDGDAAWLSSVMGLRADELEGHFRRAWDRYGAQRFAEVLAPRFLRALGDLWRKKRLRIVHEHFATEHLRDFLAQHWRRLGAAARGELVVCATLPGEPHTVGLHLAAVVLALHDRRIALLGGNTPPSEVARAVRDSDAGVVLIGSSLVPPPGFGEDLRRLVDDLQGAVPLLVGGPLPDAGLAELSGVTHIDSLSELGPWCEQRSRG